MKYHFLFFIFLTLLFACSSSSNQNVELTFNEEGFELINLPGVNSQMAVKKKEDGLSLEEGIVFEGQRHGSWYTYHPRKDMIKTVTSYAEGKLNGNHCEFNDRGQIVLKAKYLDGVLDGPFFKYNFGKPAEEAFYINGQLDGVYKLYHRNGKLQQESNFKTGKREGSAKYFNDDGNLVMSYEYKDNEIVSGGKVDSTTESAEKK